MKNRVWNWIKSHKLATAIIVCILQAFAVHALHKWYIGIPWLVAGWNPGDFLTYIANFEAFIGTVFLGLVSLDQSKKADEANRRLSEENIYLQKIMSQKLIPVIQIRSPKSVPITEGYRTLNDFPSTQSFTRKKQYLHSIGYEYIVNIDVEGDKEIHKKELSFSIENISESVIRHFCIDGIVIQGYNNIFLKLLSRGNVRFRTYPLVSVRITKKVNRCLFQQTVHLFLNFQFNIQCRSTISIDG